MIPSERKMCLEKVRQRMKNGDKIEQKKTRAKSIVLELFIIHSRKRFQ